MTPVRAAEDRAPGGARGTVVITGASAGIGRATAIEFARHGWRVALLARSADGLEGARRDVEAAGGEALAMPTDVADAAQVEAAADRVEQAWGPIDVWVNDAMATVFCDFMHMEADDFARATAVTYLGAVWGTQAALRRMQPRNRGCIVQVGSALAYRSIPLQSAYCGAKSGLRGFTDSLRSELIHDKQQGASHHGASVRVQYATVRLGPHLHGQAAAPNGQNLPARGRRARNLLGGAPPAP